MVVMTPGAYNSAYFEHAFLAQQMGVELVEGQDLFVRDDQVFVYAPPAARAGGRDLPPQTTTSIPPFPQGSDDRCAGPAHAYRAGRDLQRHRHQRGRRQVDLPYVPEMIRFYLGEEPILNNVPTLHKSRNLTLPPWRTRGFGGQEVHGAGGYGTLVGLASPSEQIETFMCTLWPTPRRRIAWFTLLFELSDLRRETAFDLGLHCPFCAPGSE